MAFVTPAPHGYQATLTFTKLTRYQSGVSLPSRFVFSQLVPVQSNQFATGVFLYSSTFTMQSSLFFNPENPDQK
jgi:hypothetical protein